MIRYSIIDIEGSEWLTVGGLADVGIGESPSRNAPSDERNECEDSVDFYRILFYYGLYRLNKS